MAPETRDPESESESDEEEEPRPSRVKISIIESQRLHHEARAVLNTASQYSEHHKLGSVMTGLHEQLVAECPDDPAAFLTELIGAAPSLESLIPEPPAPRDRELVILHFNDVCNIEAGTDDPCGGAARFAALVETFRKGGVRHRGVEPLVLFSGDAFSPSTMSTVTKGSHMVPVLNRIGVHTACFGNRDFDFGLANLEQLVGECAFPWLISNARSKGGPLAGGLELKVLHWGGHKIGLIGLVDQEWIDRIDGEELTSEDFVACGQRLARLLKAEHGAEIVVALTHMCVANDRKLAAEVPEIDLICGGHEPQYEAGACNENGTYLLKSGSDFKDLTELRIAWGAEQHEHLFRVSAANRHSVTLAMPEEPEMSLVLGECCAGLGAAMDSELAVLAVELDSRASSVRASETSLGNWVADVMRFGSGADCALINSGALRADAIVPEGVFRASDLAALLPQVDELCVLEVSPEQLMSILENGVSQYPNLDGRFPQVSGLSFSFDPSQAPGSRVLRGSIQVGGAAMEEGRVYSLCTCMYLALGKDGYSALPECEVLRDNEAMPVLPALVRSFLGALNAMSEYGATGNGVAKSMVAKLQRLLLAGRGEQLPNEEEPEDYKIRCAIEGRILCVPDRPTSQATTSVGILNTTLEPDADGAES